jgi:hypothetical protein
VKLTSLGLREISKGPHAGCYVVLGLRSDGFTGKLTGRVRVTDARGNSYGRPELNRWWPVNFHGLGGRYRVYSGLIFNVTIADFYLNNIQDNEWAFGLICFDQTTWRPFDYMNDLSGTFDLEIELWAVTHWWNRWFRNQRKVFQITFHSHVYDPSERKAVTGSD